MVFNIWMIYDSLLPCYSCEMILQGEAEQTLENMCAAVGIRKVGVHALRHTYATRLFEKGVDIKIISELLGHSSTEITYRIYVHVIDSLKESAVEALDLD